MFGDSYTKNRDRLFFFVAFEAQRQKVDSGSHFTRTFSQAMRNGDFSELLANRGSNLNSIPQLRIPQGLPGRRATRRRTTTCAPYIDADWASTSPASIRSRTTTIRPICTTTSTASSSRTNRYDFKARFDWNISNSTKAYVRIAREGETAESPRGVWWAPADVVALPTPNIGENRGRSYRRQRRLGAEPVDDQRGRWSATAA